MSMIMDDDEDEKPRGRRPVRDDDDDEDEPRGRERDDDQDDDEQDDDPDAGKSEDDLRAELKRLRAEHSKAKKQGERRRGQLAELRKRIGQTEDTLDDNGDEDEKSEPKSKGAKDGGTSTIDVERAVRKAVEKERKAQEAERVKERITSKAETALASAGVQGKSIRMLVRELDFDDLEVEKDGSIDGLDEQIDALREDYPALFGKANRRRERINGGDDRDGRRDKPKSASQRQADMVLGRGR